MLDAYDVWLCGGWYPSSNCAFLSIGTMFNVAQVGPVHAGSHLHVPLPPLPLLGCTPALEVATVRTSTHTPFRLQSRSVLHPPTAPATTPATTPYSASPNIILLLHAALRDDWCKDSNGSFLNASLSRNPL